MRAREDPTAIKDLPIKNEDKLKMVITYGTS